MCGSGNSDSCEKFNILGRSDVITTKLGCDVCLPSTFSLVSTPSDILLIICDAKDDHGAVNDGGVRRWVSYRIGV